MKKIIWLIIGIGSAFLSSMYFYEGGKLLFLFHDLRQGILVAASGCAVFLLFIWSMMRFYNVMGMNSDGLAVRALDRYAAILVRKAVNTAVFGCFISGIILYLLRFHSILFSLAVTAAVIIAAVTAAFIRVIYGMLSTGYKENRKNAEQ